MQHYLHLPLNSSPWQKLKYTTSIFHECCLFYFQNIFFSLINNWKFNLIGCDRWGYWHCSNNPLKNENNDNCINASHSNGIVVPFCLCPSYLNLYPFHFFIAVVSIVTIHRVWHSNSQREHFQMDNLAIRIVRRASVDLSFHFLTATVDDIQCRWSFYDGNDTWPNMKSHIPFASWNNHKTEKMQE